MQVIQKFLKNSLRNFNYIIISDHSSESIFIDPFDLTETLPLIGDKKPKYLINTHHHHDHVRDNERFLSLDNTQKLVLADGEYFELSPNEKIKAVHTPGHVNDHICYFLYQDDCLTGIISGDTIFNGGVGNCKNGGNPDDLYETIKNIFNPIEENPRIYPSHDYFLTNLKFAQTLDPDNEDIRNYIKQRESMDLDEEFIPTSLNDEKKINPFFRALQGLFDDQFPEKSERDIFKAIRAKRDKW